MFRRLNFLLPDIDHAKNVVNELHELGVKDKQIHTLYRHDSPAASLYPASKNLRGDKAEQLENKLWNGNLVFFFIFLVLFIATLITENYLFAIGCLGLMIISFAVGNFFARHIPHVHLNQFKNALSHNELLLMVDIPDSQLGNIEDNIHRHHPYAIDGGSSWMLKGVDI